MSESTKNQLKHIVGTFLIQAEGAFLNGSMQENDDEEKKYKITPPKTVKEFNNKIPYVSAQAWRRWLRDTYVQEHPDDPTTPIEATDVKEGEDESKELNTKKVGTAIDPIEYVEHDIFGYMNTKEGQGKKGVKATIRSSPFQSSILLSVRKSGWEGKDKGVAYPKSVAISFYEDVLDSLLDKEKKKSGLSDENQKTIKELKALLTEDIAREDLVEKLVKGLSNLHHEKEQDKIEDAIRKVNDALSTPLPFRTRFYNTHLQGIFGLALHRIGLFRNAGDREELEKKLVEKYLHGKTIEEVNQPDKRAKIYRIKDDNIQLTRAEKILKSLAVLRGGAKQAQFGTDVSPKVIIIAGLSSGNLIFNDLFEDTKEFVTNGREKDGEIIESQVAGGVRLKLDTLKQTIWDYRDRIVTPVFIGLRTGYLSKSSETELKKWVKNPDFKVDDFNCYEEGNENNAPSIILCSPIDAINKLIEKIKPKNEES